MFKRLSSLLKTGDTEIDEVSDCQVNVKTRLVCMNREKCLNFIIFVPPSFEGSQESVPILVYVNHVFVLSRSSGIPSVKGSL